MDLSKLIGGESLTLPWMVNNNQLGIKTSALIDTGANGFIFIDTEFAKLVCYHLDLTPKLLPVSCGVQGFDGRAADAITSYIELNLYIDGRKQIRLPMLILKLGKHDIIAGREWAAQFGILIDCKNRQLVWPENQPKAREWHKILATHKRNLLSGISYLEHQQDV